MKKIRLFWVLFAVLTMLSCQEPRVATLWMIGDSTMADYANYGEDYMRQRYPMTGWGQALPAFLVTDSLAALPLFQVDSIRLENKARGGRSSRSFFEEGRWREVFDQLKPGDFVIIQFGHNDASVSKGERYVSLPGYKEFLRLYVSQARQKGATPILITSVCRNYPWEDGVLGNSHGDYPQAMREVAEEMGVFLIDLTEISAAYFTSMSREYVTEHFFMNLPAGTFEAYPEGLTDNTHFQPEGAREVARLVFEGLKSLK